jgi:hypothetical protein
MAIKKPRTPDVPSQPASFLTSSPQGWEQSMPYPPHSSAMWMQQMRMMESFHNDMILMVQMFVTMHREHVASVHFELDRVQQLTQELSDLQAKLAQPSGSSNGALPGLSNASLTTHGQIGVSRKRNPDSPALEGRDTGDHGDAKPRKAEYSHASRTPEPGSRKEFTRTESGENAAPGDAQIHAEISERISELQRERQGYWQRILSALHQ